MKVALDIGHCSTGDQGAVSRDGLAEHPFWAQYTPAIVRELEKLGHQAAAERLGLSLWSCQKRMQRIRKKLRAQRRKLEGGTP